MILTTVLYSCETSYDATFKIQNNLANNHIYVHCTMLSFPNDMMIISPLETSIIEEIHAKNLTCGVYDDYVFVLSEADIGKIDGNDTIYSQNDFTDIGEWINECDDRKRGVVDIYTLILDESDF